SGSSSSQQSIIEILQRITPPHKGIKKINIYQAVAKWLVIDNQPLDTVNGEGF
ncbi:16468_t:CDS:1, partial [Dentiscutata erythropus]